MKNNRRIFVQIQIICTAIVFWNCTRQRLTDHSATQFEKHILTNDFISEGVAVGDVNNDGVIDILAGAYWFEAPHWQRHEIDSGKTFDPDTEYSNSFLNFSMDVNSDGWIDLIRVDFPGKAVYWHENPKGNNQHWKVHIIYERVGNESPRFVDMDKDGFEDLLFGDTENNQMIWLKSPSGKEDLTWKKFTISEPNASGTEKFSHGLGYGDINGDGIKDVIIKDGWWQGPSDVEQPNWTFHPTSISENCSQMFEMDVNGDNKADVISGSAHLSGVWWQEQKELNEQGVITFETHVISYAFAESHALIQADLNDDGHLDIVTGKRSLRRGTWRKNPGTEGPPLLYWYEYKPEEPYWIPHEIDQDSGAGLNIAVQDVTNDGKKDIIIANFKGVFLFENRMENK